MFNKKENAPEIVMDERTARRERAKKRIRKRRIVTSLAIVASLLAGYAIGRYQYLAFESIKGSTDPVAVEQDNVKEEPKNDTEDSTEATMANTATALTITPAENIDYGVELTTPVNYSLYQALKQLRNVEATDERYSKILEDPSIYPEKMLINLANNPEQLDFVYNYPKNEKDKSQAILTEDELNAECPLFIQWDQRWGYLSYGDDSNIAISGCGPTSLAMVIVGLTDNKKATPAQVAEYSMENGHYMNGTGTAWTLMLEGAEDYGLKSERIGINPNTMKKASDSGAYLIVSVDAGDFTTGGHFIVIYDYDENGFCVNDPNSVYRSNKRWTYDQLAGQIKAIWSLKSAK